MSLFKKFLTVLLIIIMVISMSVSYVTVLETSLENEYENKDYKTMYGMARFIDSNYGKIIPTIITIFGFIMSYAVIDDKSSFTPLGAFWGLLVVLFFISLGVFIHFSTLSNKQYNIPTYIVPTRTKQKISLKYSGSDGKDYFLTIAPNTSCGNISSDTSECQNHVAILQDIQDGNTLFTVTPQAVGSSKFKIHNIDLDKTLNNLDKQNTPLCFDGGNDINIYFDMEKVGDKIMLKTNTKGVDLYAIRCLATSRVCVKNGVSYKQICMSADKSKAILFDVVEQTITTAGTESYIDVGSDRVGLYNFGRIVLDKEKLYFIYKV